MNVIASLIADSGLSALRPERVRTSAYDRNFHREIAYADRATIDQAVETARRFALAYFGAPLPDSTSIEILRKLTGELRQHIAWLAEVEACWTSRSWTELHHHSIPKSIETIQWFCDNAQTAFSSVDKLPDIPGIEYKVDPIGVVAAITPWNDPLVAFSWKVVPPLIAGNCVIWKPSENCLETAYWVVAKMHELGLPKEKLQLIVGDGSAGDLLAASKVNGLTFTGSTKTAQTIAGTVYRKSLPKLHMEAGGKGCALLDADGTAEQLDRHVEDLCEAAFFNQGQICSAPTVVFVRESRLDSVVDAFKRKAQRYSPGNPLDKTQRTGGLISREKRENLEQLLRGSVDGEVVRLTSTSDGLHGLDPSLVVFPSEKSHFVRHELFGPIITLQPYSCFESFIGFINEQQYGLANGIYTSSKSVADAFKSRASGGILHINSWGRDPVGVPFGGIRDSGFGKEKCLDTILYFANLKPICQL
jgi:acyl-CoA reductase-like NAD-dependent aldehyde dehydrogenase